MGLMRDHLPELMGPIARELLGEPNRGMSSKTELRFGSNGSMSVDLDKGTYFDHESGLGGGVLDLVTRQTGLHGNEREEWVSQRHPEAVDKSKSNGTNGRKSNGVHKQQRAPLGKEVAWYDYVDESGTLLFQVVRYEPKEFRQRRRARPDDDPWKVHDGWVANVKGVRQVPFRLPELIETVASGHLVFVVEGERDVESLASIGVHATCNAGGAGKWPDGLSEHFRDAHVIVIADNDPQAKTRDGSLRFHDDGRPVYPGQDHARAVCEQLADVAESVRYLDLKAVWPACPVKGDATDWIKSGGTAEKLYEIGEAAPTWSPELPPMLPEGRAFDPISTYRDPATIPKRRWLYARQYIRGAVSATVADGGTGKTNLAIAEGIAIATGRNLLGVAVPEPVNVLYWNGEEPLDEIERRVHAICQHYGIDATGELTGHFFMMSGLTTPITLAAMVHGALVFDEAICAAVDKALEQLNIGVFMLDPFVSCHRIPESDNTHIDAVVKRFASIANRRQTSIELVHHTRKMPAGGGTGDATLADTRGASALINAARAARVLNRMSEAQARMAGVSDHRPYFRADNGKANYAPAPLATWFKTTNEELANGDSVAALEQFTFPSAFDDVRPDHIETVRKRVREGGPYRADSQSEGWVGEVVAEVCDLDTEVPADKNKVKAIIKEWIANKMLFKRDHRDPTTRKFRAYIFADAAKAQADEDEPPADLFEGQEGNEYGDHRQ